MSCLRSEDKVISSRLMSEKKLVEEKNGNRSRFKMTLDNMVNSIKRTFLGNNINNNSNSYNKNKQGNHNICQLCSQSFGI